MSLYGGQEGLLNKLDTYFLTPERADKSGSYGHVIHEMLEARDVRMGQLGMSNQPSHHIPYMYAAAGMPYKTQMYTREILQRLYIGSDIGQGYCGDEDNGEMSA
jgi:putative alpha-1,2-mannosidase